MKNIYDNENNKFCKLFMLQLRNVNFQEDKFWSDADHELDSDIACINKERVEVDTTLNKGAGLIRLSLMFLFSWQRLFNVFDVGLDILFKFIAHFYDFLPKFFSTIKG